MKRIVLILILITLIILSGHLEAVYIDIHRENIGNLKIPLDVIGYNREENTFTLHVPDSLLNKINVPFTIRNIKSSPKGYLNSSAIIDSLISLHNNYPLLTYIDTIGYTYEGKPIVVLFVGKDTLNSALLLMGCHHAREWQTPGVVLFFVDSLLRSSSLPQIDSLLDRVSLYAIPLVNPDGYDYSLTVENAWRKNRRFFPEYDEYGVDLNRNYGGGCNGNVYSDWGTTINSATSHIISTDTYCGDMPFSEKETSAIRDFIINHPQIRISISYHSYGEEVLYPWASINKETPHDDIIRYLAYQIASRIIGRNGLPYDTLRSAALYPTTGDSDDWIYGYSTYVLGNTIIPFTIECDNTFQPDTSQLRSLYENNYVGILYAFSYVESLSIENIVRINDLDCKIKGDSIYLYFDYKNAADGFLIKRYIGYFNTLERFEEGAYMYNLDGFRVTPEMCYSGNYSITQNSESFSYSCIESRMPLNSDTISFYLNYSINDGNMLYFEVSKDGYYWYPPTKQALFVGNSDGWYKFECKLPDSLLFIRFRFTTSLYSGDNIYIDDIFPAPHCDSMEEYYTCGNSFILSNSGNEVINLRGYNSLGEGSWTTHYIKGGWMTSFSLSDKWYFLLPIISDDWEANVYDILGRKVAYYNYPYYTNKIWIDATKLPTGIYVVKVFNNNMELSHGFKFIKIGGVNE